MFSNTLSFLSSRNVSDQVSHPYKTTGKIIVKRRYNIRILKKQQENEDYISECGCGWILNENE